MKAIKQHDERDCGSACLSMISEYYGLKYPISKFRELTKTDRNGSSLYGLVDAAGKLGFSSDALSGTFEELEESIANGEIKLPFVAHIINEDGMYHFIVVYKISGGRIFAADPGKGKVRIPIDLFVKIWNGYIVTFEKTEAFVPGNHRKGTLKKFFSLLQGEKSKLFLIVVISFIVSLIGIAGSYVFRIVIDSLTTSTSSSGTAEFGASITEKISSFISANSANFDKFFIALIALYILQAAIQFARGYLMALMSKNLDIRLMISYYNHIIDMPVSLISTRNTGEYLSRFSDASTIRNAVSGATLTLVMDSLMAVACGVILFLQNRILFLVSLIMVLFYWAVVMIYKKPIKETNREYMEDDARVESYLKETIDGVETIKANLAETRIKAKNSEKFMNMMKSGMKNSMLSFSQDSICDMAELVGTVVILWIGFSLVMKGTISMGSLMTFYALLSYFTSPIKNLIGLQPMIQSAVVAAERLNDILDLETENYDDEKSKENIDVEKISIDNVDFRYGNHNKTLENFSLTMNKGEKIALVGESGSGKTTIAKLLMKFYDYEAGSITINGRSLKDYSVDEIRNTTAYVNQNTFLFSDTVKNNLRLSCPDATDEDIERVCRLTKADEFIKKLPFGYDTFLDENGRNLSGGERQRLSIARALLKNPQILILDEATSNLDTITEKAIHEMLNEISKDMTCIVIAHRLSTIKNCDRIAVVENGTVSEIGTHDELMEKGGKYSALWNKNN